MIMRIVLDSVERDALRRLAIIERRREEAQAALMIRRALELAGMLPYPQPLPVSEEVPAAPKADATSGR